MVNVFYAWELGSNLGHIGAFLPIARQLRERQHTVHWVVAQPHQAARLLPAAGFGWLQAPRLPELRQKMPPLNYADILLRYGYAQPQDLLGLVVGWRTLMQQAQAAVVIVDHAPTAILAARTLGLPVMLFGTGFVTPPVTHPTPNMRPWLPVTQSQLLQADAQVLASINAVLHHFGQAPISRVADLFQVEEQALCTFAELDHYENRANGRYWGLLPYTQAAPPRWPEAIGPKVFAYLRPKSAHFEAALQALHQLEGSILVFAPGISPQLCERFTARHMHFSVEPVDLKLAAQEADAALTYGSPSASVAFLLAGKPAVMLPGHLEQFLQARRIVQLGAGLLIAPNLPATELPTLLQKVLTEPSFTVNARAFAQKHAGFSQEALVATLTQRIEDIAADRSQKSSARQVEQPMDNSNARYVEDLGEVVATNLHGRLTPAQQNAIVHFWLTQGAIQNEPEARRRSHEVVHLAFDQNGRIVAVNTCFKGKLDTVSGPVPYWFYRTYIAPKARSIRLFRGLFRLTARYLAGLPRSPGTEHGIAVRLENPKFYKRSGRWALGRVGIKPLGKDAGGAEIWVYDFPPTS